MSGTWQHKQGGDLSLSASRQVAQKMVSPLHLPNRRAQVQKRVRALDSAAWKRLQQVAACYNMPQDVSTPQHGGHRFENDHIVTSA